MLDDIKKDSLNDLSVSNGGIAFALDRPTEKPNPTIVFSLGGLGGSTVNELKGKFIKAIGTSDHTFFRVIDTAARDTNGICALTADGHRNPNPNAYMDRTEIISLYNPVMTHDLELNMIRPNVKAWLNPKLINTLLDDTGAKQKRQIGRAMLLDSNVYAQTNLSVKSVINQAIAKQNGEDPVDVIIIAGISGGTGSGTIIDFTYMVHHAFEDVGFETYNIAGYIYTPEAQFQEQGIKESDTIKLNLKKNGYAALKEIDHFMNIKETNDRYELNLGDVGGNSLYTCSKNIFKTCTIVSGFSMTGGINELSDTRGRLTDQLLDQLTDISFIKKGEQQQLSSSFMSNEDAMTDAFFKLHSSRRDYHRYASYKYQVLGYSALRIPNSEIFAYLVDKLYTDVMKKYQNYSILDSELMAGILKRIKLDSEKSFRIYATTFDQSRRIDLNINVDEKSTKSQIKSDHMVGFNEYRDLARPEIKKLNEGYKVSLEDELMKLIENELNNIFEQYGPFMALKLLNHTEDELGVGNGKVSFKGLIEQIDAYIKSFKEAASKAESRQNSVDERMKEAAANATKLLGRDKITVDEYYDLAKKYAVSIEINAPLYTALADVLSVIKERLQKKMESEYEVFTSILEYIKYIITTDNDYFDESNQNGVTNDIIKSGSGNVKYLQYYLDSLLTTINSDDLSKELYKSMTRGVGEDKGENWLANKSPNNFQVPNEIRTIFQDFFKKYGVDKANGLIEKVLIATYSDEMLDVNKLAIIWDEPGKTKMTAILDRAARDIYQKLSNGATVMAQSDGLAFKTNFNYKTFVGAIKDATTLRNLLDVQVAADTNQTIADSTATDKFIMTTQYYNLPLYILAGMRDYNSVYDKNPTDGLHMDENNVDWRKWPNPYTVDAYAKDLAVAKRNFLEMENYSDYVRLVDFKKMFDHAKDDLHSIVAGKDGNLEYLYLWKITREPNWEEFTAKLTDAVTLDPELDYVEFMQKNGYVMDRVDVTQGATDIELTRFDIEHLEDDLSILRYQGVFVPIADIYKWLRKNNVQMEVIKDNIPKFEKVLNYVKEVKVKTIQKRRYNNDIELFVHSLRAGILKMKEGEPLIWSYLNNKTPVIINLRAHNRNDQKYYLYHVFCEFSQMDDLNKKKFETLSRNAILNDQEVDIQFVKDHVEQMKSEDEFGDPYGFRKMDFNKEYASKGLQDHYQYTNLDDYRDTYEVLKQFYELVEQNF